MDDLEPRVVPSSSSFSAHTTFEVGPFGEGSPPSGAFTPAQLQEAYGFSSISFNGVSGTGAGETIAIVDAYDDPNIQADLNTFDNEFQLPATTVTRVNETGGTNYPGSDPTGGWELEESLDVEWAHAMAPGAKILLVEASSPNTNDLLSALQYAAAHANVVSMSWGGSEFSGETAYDSEYFDQPGVAFVASSGDSGAPASWPATSPNVLGVGGTSLTLGPGNVWSSEVGWSDSTGGPSAYESQPSYQNGVVTQTSTARATPDVAYDANPATGVAVYDSVPYEGTTYDWIQVGGTSAGAPQWSALLAIADQGRALSGQAALNSNNPQQVMNILYTNPTDFHDITSGTSTGSPRYSAGPGYDYVTGMGSPIANLIVGSLDGTSSASFLSTNTATQGNWIGTYGSQGYNVINNAASLPSYATITPTDQSNDTWTASTTDPRTLQDASGSGRIAACWYAPSSFTVNVNLTDGQTHDLELYFLDWDSTTRSEQVQITNASTGAVLDTQTVSSFHSGVYLAWAVSGNVNITFTHIAGANAVLSGIFLNSTAPPAATASFIKQDTTAQGNWIGTYGSQGYDVINNAASLPSYATITPTGQSNDTWTASTTDPRALQDASGSGRIAACWYTPSSFTVNVNLTDGQTHNLELYFLDWDSTTRSEQVQITNASTGALLDTQTVSSFHSGAYLVWAVSGDLNITFTHIAGANAVLSGLFFGPPPSASFLSTNTATQGNWIGSYGSQGYNLINNAASLPSYATITPTGQSNDTWAASTTDLRALQDASGSGRIAACWYAPSSFTVNVNLTDGQTHNLELYFLDWDSTTRSEQVQITNASTGAVLDTQTVSSFHSGVYLAWAVSGNVNITFTDVAGANAVLSGLFLDPA